MKFRQGFVSNSSSTSFLVVAADTDEIEVTFTVKVKLSELGYRAQVTDVDKLPHELFAYKKLENLRQFAIESVNVGKVVYFDRREDDNMGGLVRDLLFEITNQLQDDEHLFKNIKGLAHKFEVFEN